MSRIFTFGCSFTKYVWPTWADIILYGNEGYNLGICGGGFDSILYRIMEADRIFKFSPDDNIIVMLTTPIRFDLLLGDEDNLHWNCFGQIITSPFAKNKDEIFSIDGLLYKSFYNIILISDYLKKTNSNFVLGSVNNPFFHVGNYFDDITINNKMHDLITYVKNNIDLTLQDFYSFLNKDKKIKKWTTSKKWKDYDDYHPRPTDHYKWIKEILLKKVNINLNFTEDMLKEIEKIIDSYDFYKDSHLILLRHPQFFESKYGDIAFFDRKKKLKKLI